MDDARAGHVKRTDVREEMDLIWDTKMASRYSWDAVGGPRDSRSKSTEIWKGLLATLRHRRSMQCPVGRMVGCRELKLPGNGPRLWLPLRTTRQLQKILMSRPPLPDQIVPGHLRATAGMGIRRDPQVILVWKFEYQWIKVSLLGKEKVLGQTIWVWLK